MTRITKIMDLLSGARGEELRNLRDQLEAARREASTAAVDAELWRRRHSEAQVQVEDLTADLGRAHNAERAALRQVADLHTELAEIRSGPNAPALLEENRRLGRALKECEDRREELRLEVERLEAERMGPRPGRREAR